MDVLLAMHTASTAHTGQWGPHWPPSPGSQRRRGADADDDGAHIRCLLLTFFYRFMRPLLTAGRIFIAQPPLFKVTRRVKKRTESKYLWSQAELTALTSKWGAGSVVQRFKGLGEMDPDQLWETTMNPTTRTLLRVNIEDAANAERQVTVLMGSRSEPRRNWITSNVRFGENHDDEEQDAVDEETVEDEMERGEA